MPRSSQQDLDRSIRISFTFSVLLGVLLSALGILCAPILLRITAADASIYAAALTYLRIYLAGLMFTVIYQFVSLPCKAFGLTITTIVSQNMGTGNYAGPREGIAKCMALSLCTIAALGAVTYVFADCCVALFNPDPEVVAVGIAMMHTIIPLYFTMAIREVFLGALRGYGNARTPMFISLFGMIVIRQIYLFIAMNHAYRIEFIYYCYPIAWGSTAFMLVIYYFLTRKQYAQFCANKPVKQ